jgi:PadR family transcriptional regulator, regulatory protein PadR
MGMREPTYFLLAGLLDGPRHGYAIAQIARELSSGGVGMSAGTLYGALERLSDQGLIRAVEEVRVGGRRRRVYELTEDGRSQLIEEAQRLREAADVVTARLRAGEGGQAEIDRVAAEVARRTEERLASR